MKKGDIAEGVVCRMDFPNRGIVSVRTDEGTMDVMVKHALPGQRVSFRLTKKRQGRAEGRLLSVVEESPNGKEERCPHAASCGGCLYQGFSYEWQLKNKEAQIYRLLAPVIGEETYADIYEGIIPSPSPVGYRNKMELSFGDDIPQGPLQLGMHKRGSFYDIVTTDACRIMDADMCKVLRVTLSYFRERNISYYHKRTHQGYLRHLLLRKAAHTGEILVDLVTSTDETHVTEEDLLWGWMQALRKETYEGSIVGILHTVNDRPADVIENQGTTILYGQEYFTEQILGLSFRITPFSFFQTNSRGAEVLYETAQRWIWEAAGIGNDIPGAAVEGRRLARVFDLYAGTGTIAQVLSSVADEVIGVEIVPEAVEAAVENARVNGLDHCRFICGDVLKVLDDLKEKPDMIVLDPPRDGIHPKALPKLLAYGVEHILYISCKATSLARDLPAFLSAGYTPSRLSLVDLFPYTGGVETVCMLSKQNRVPDTYLELEIDADEYMRIVGKDK